MFNFNQYLHRTPAANHHPKALPPAQFEDAQFDDAAEDEQYFNYINNHNFTTTYNPNPPQQQHTSNSIPTTVITVTPNRSRCNTDESWGASSTHSALTNGSGVSVYAIEVRPEDRNENDVLLGRGKGPNNFIGNRRFRELVAQYQQEYFELKRNEKPIMAEKVAALVGKMEPAGRFLRLDASTGMWCEVSEQEAVRKTGQLLREGKLQRQKKRSNCSDRPEDQHKAACTPSRGPLKKRHFPLADQMHSLSLSMKRG